MMSITDTQIVERTTMTNVEQPRPLPQSTVQLAAVTSEAVVSGLAKSPYMLGIVALNVIGIVAAVYFLNLLIGGQQQHLKSLVEIQQQQLDKVIAMHTIEFNALLEMSNRLTTEPPPSPIAPGSPILTQPPAQPMPRR